MLRACDVCRAEYDAKRPSSRYCSPRCRQRKARGQVAAETPPVREAVVDSGLVDATRRRLTEARALDTVDGQAALVLAHRIETGLTESGSAVAALSRELRAVMDAALKTTAPVGNLIDELRAQREKRRPSA